MAHLDPLSCPLSLPVMGSGEDCKLLSEVQTIWRTFEPRRSSSSPSRFKHGSHYILVLKFKDFSRTFKDPEVAFSRSNSRWKFAAWTVLQQYLISISVITGQFSLIKTKHDNYSQLFIVLGKTPV